MCSFFSGSQKDLININYYFPLVCGCMPYAIPNPTDEYGREVAVCGIGELEWTRNVKYIEWFMNTVYMLIPL